MRRLYFRLVIEHPLLAMFLVFGLVIVSGWKLGEFRLDASSETLMMENDPALERYRTMNQRFGASDDFLVVTFNPRGDLFTEESIGTLRRLRDELAALEGVKSTNSILSVPLLHHPKLSLSSVQPYLLTLDEDPVPLDRARQSLVNNPLYRNLLISEDGQTTAIQVNLPTPQRYYDLLAKRNKLQDLARQDALDASGRMRLEQAERQFNAYRDKLSREQRELVGRVRALLPSYREKAEIHLGGVPMIVTDMIRFIERDLRTFGVGVLLFILLTLAIIFRRWRGVAIPAACCGLAVWTMLGLLGWAGWPVTVVSSNFISLLLIITLSLTIHLMVRYREARLARPDAEQGEWVRESLAAMARPCLYMTLTSLVAFSSLTLSGIRPVIDFGLMMSLGLVVAFVLAFLVFPALLMITGPGRRPSPPGDGWAPTGALAWLTEHHGKAILGGSLVLAIVCTLGLGRLSVENRFIDYFKPSTEIYQGMKVIDTRLGGTTPLDVIVADPERAGETKTGDPACDPFIDPECDQTRDTWFTAAKMDRLERIHEYLAGLPEGGKALSIITTLRLVEIINGGQPLDPVQLAFVPKVFPESLRDTLVTPYINEEHAQARFNLRLIESSKQLERDALIDAIRRTLQEEMGFAPDQVQLTGMAVMFNNLLQSLFDSQIRTLGVVFLAIFIMFLVLFRSLSLAVIGLMPNLLAAVSVLGLMGWLGIPLDIMTITVAAITVGIAVDDTIHYIHRFRQEFRQDGDYLATMHRCHRSIGRAMLYTSVTVVAGFSILVLSNFMPTIYFGAFTALAMAVALVGALTLLPRLILLWRPLG